MDVLPDKRYVDGVASRPTSNPVVKGSVPQSDVGNANANTIQNEYIMLIGKRPKLYDLNKNFTNFEIEFQIDAERPDLRFYVHILPQDQLDKTDLDDIPMKSVQGKISGKVSNNNNIYQNYFIILKNDADEEAKVTIRTRTLVFPVTVPDSSTPAHPISPDSSSRDHTPGDLPTEHYANAQGYNMNAPSQWYRRPPFLYAIIGVVILIGIVIIFFFWRPRKNMKKSSYLEPGYDDPIYDNEPGYHSRSYNSYNNAPAYDDDNNDHGYKNATDYGRTSNYETTLAPTNEFQHESELAEQPPSPTRSLSNGSDNSDLINRLKAFAK